MTRGMRSLALLTACLASVVQGCDQGPDGPIRASGTVEATDADLGFQLPGRIDSILVREGDSVETGQVVAYLDQAELQARRRAAVAQRNAAQALLAELEAGFRPEEVGEGRAGLRQAEERRIDARRDWERAQILFEGGGISQEARDKAETALRLADAAVDAAEQRFRLLEEGVRDERIAAQKALVEQAKAAVGQIDATLESSVITVPFGGVVTLRHREPGETVSAGMPVLTVMDPSDRWVRIYVREDRIGAVGLGHHATVTADTYPDREYQGDVVFISSEAEFTPRNVQTTEERVKLVYAVKVRITEDPTYDLKPGLAADVVLDADGTAGD